MSDDEADDGAVRSDGVNLLADDLLLLILDERTGRFPDRLPLNGVAAVALLLEIASMGRLDVFGEDHRIFVEDASPTGHPILDGVLATIGEDEGALPKNVLAKYAVGSFERAVARLTGRGLLREETSPRMFGLLRRTTWRHADRDRITMLRAELDEVLVRDRRPDARTATLVAMLVVLGQLDRVLGSDGHEHATARAEQIAEDAWDANTVTFAILDKTDIRLQNWALLTEVGPAL